jgi:hypothetical protein
MAVAQKSRLTREEQGMLTRLLSLQQTGGATESAAIDRDFLMSDGNYDLFFLHYFPNDFQSFEPFNYKLMSFLEGVNLGMAWCPGGTGKTTTVLHFMAYVMCREPQISFIYVEKSEPAAHARARALMDILEYNKDLVHDFGEFKSHAWSADAITIKQRPLISQWPTVAFYGAQSKATLGSRCNIIIVDDPVTADNSNSPLERERLRDWYAQAASTCPYPLPLSRRDQYIRKSFLIGTTFHMDDLYHTVLKTGMYEHLWLKAVDLATGECLAPNRFTYRTTEELKVTAEDSAADAYLLERVTTGKVISLGDFRKASGTKAFMRRYQNEVRDDATAKFPELWFRGGSDEWSPPGGYSGCLEDNVLHPGRSLGEKPGAGLTYVTGVDPAAGTKGSYTVRFACCTLGCDLIKDPNTVYLIDLDFGQQPMVSDNPSKTSQVDISLRHSKEYGSRIVLEVNNVQGVWAQAIQQEANRRGQHVNITGHYTSSSKKVNPEQGIEAMTAMIENGHLRLPYKMPSDRKVIDELIEEFTYWGSYATDDILMAFWLAWRVLERMRRNRVVKPVEMRELPAWRAVGDRFNFPPGWNDQRKAAFLGLVPAEETDEDSE